MKIIDLKRIMMLIAFAVLILCSLPAVMINGIVDYAGQQALTNFRIQIVSASDGSIQMQQPVSLAQSFTMQVDSTASFYLVALADIIGQNTSLYGSPGGLSTPLQYDPQSVSSISAGTIMLSDLAPPSRDVTGTAYLSGERLVYPVYHYNFVYAWDYANHLFQSGDFLYLLKHERRFEGQIYPITLVEPILWHKVQNLQHGDSWQRVEVASHEGGMLIYIYKYYEFFSQDSQAPGLTKVIDVTNCHYIRSYTLTINDTQSRRYNYLNDNLTSVEDVDVAESFYNLVEDNTWSYQPIPTQHNSPHHLLYNIETTPNGNPSGIHILWQAPVNDLSHTWTHYRIYYNSTQYHEVPYMRTQFAADFTEEWSTQIRICATDGTDESPFSETIDIPSLANNDEIAPQANVRAFPNPLRRGQSLTLEQLKSTGEIDLEIYNLRGQLLYKQRLNSGSDALSWDTTGFYEQNRPAGIYLLRIISPTNELLYNTKLLIVP